MLQAYQADDTRGLNLDVQLLSFAAAPVYVPAYVFRSRDSGGEKVRTFVAGWRSSSGPSTVAVAGTHVYSPTRVGAAVGLAAAALMLVSGLLKTHPPLMVFWLGVMLPGVAAAAATRFWPWLRNKAHRVAAESEQYWYRESDEQGQFDTDFVHAYTQFEAFRRQREEQANHDYFRQQAGPSARVSHGDPKGYYRTLGLKAGASQSEIQAAFRGLAMKLHPDKQPESKKDASSKQFREVMEAYSTLRDTRRRKQYDLGQL